MKICPQCRQSYPDDSLNFCLTDGATLQFATQNNPSFQFQPALPRRKKSRAWLWVLGSVVSILAVLTILFFTFVGAVLYVADPNLNTNSVSNTRSNTNYIKKTPALDKNIIDDFSTWTKESNEFGDSNLEAGEFTASTKKLNYYYVLLTGDKSFRTADATTQINVRNTTGKGTGSGYGLVVASNPDKALKKDYAFLIDGERQSYRIVKHDDSNETIVVGWTKFPIIKKGKETNELKVKDSNGKMIFYINDIMATTVSDAENYTQGVAGVYVSDIVPIAFSNLQISK